MEEKNTRNKESDLLPFTQMQANADHLVQAVTTILAQLPPKLFPIGIRQRVTIERILLLMGPRLATEKEGLPTILSLIGPVICTSSEQQAFYLNLAKEIAEKMPASQQDTLSIDVSDNTSTAIKASKVKEADDPEAKAALQADQRRDHRTSLLIILVFFLVVFGLLGVMVALSKKGLEPEIPKCVPAELASNQTECQKNTSQVESAQVTLSDLPYPAEKPSLSSFNPFSPNPSSLHFLVASFPLLLALLVVSRRRKLQRYLDKRITKSEANDDPIQISGAHCNLLGSHIQQRLLPLKTPRETPANHLHIARSIDATLQALGRPEPRFALRRVAPEYLLISRCGSDNDHLDSIAGVLLDTLRQEEIHVRHYTFWRGSSRLVEVRRAKGGDVADRKIQDLPALASLFPDHRVIVLDEPRRLLNPRGLLASWTEHFSAWPDKVWLSPTAQPVQKEEAAIKGLGFCRVSLASADPLTSLCNAFSGITPIEEDKLVTLYPVCLRLDAESYVCHSSPGAEKIALLMAALQKYLGELGFFWLQACALFPVLTPAFTQYLGLRLQDKNQRNLYSLPRYTLLSRLPWFQSGDMPNWLRQSLLALMPSEARESVRNVVVEALQPSGQSKLGDFSIPVIRKYRHRLIDRIADRLRADPAHSDRSQILIDFLRDRRPLSLFLPKQIFRGWREVLTPDAWLIILLGVLASVLVFGLANLFQEGLPKWVMNTFSLEPNFAVRGSIAVICGSLAIFSLLWWVIDLLWHSDARKQWQPWIMILSIALVLVSLLSLSDAAITASLLGIFSGVNWLNGWPNIQFLLGLLGISVAYLRLLVTPCLPPKIAVLSLYESILQASLWQIFARFLVYSVLCVMVVSVLGFFVAGNEEAFYFFGSWWAYSFFLPLDGKPLTVLRPVFSFPLLVAALIGSLKPVLEDSKLARQIVFSVFLGALVAECSIEVAFWLAIEYFQSMLVVAEYLPVTLLPACIYYSIALVLYRYQLLSGTSIFGFSIAMGITGAALLYFFGSNDESSIADSAFLAVKGGLSTLFFFLFQPIAGYFGLWANGIRLPITRVFLSWLLLIITALICMYLYYTIIAEMLFSVVITIVSLFVLYYFTIIFLTLVWLHWITSIKNTSTWQRYPAQLAWLLIPILALLTLRFPTELIAIELKGLLPVIAIFLGFRYRKSGFIIFAIGALPICFSFFDSSLWPSIEYYILALIFCRAAGDPDWLEIIIEQFKTNSWVLPVIFTLSPIVFYFDNGKLSFGSGGSLFWVFGSFFGGLLFSKVRFILVWGSLVSILGIILARWFDILAFGEGKIGFIFRLDSLVDIITIWVAVGLGYLLAVILGAAKKAVRIQPHNKAITPVPSSIEVQFLSAVRQVPLQYRKWVLPSGSNARYFAGALKFRRIAAITASVFFLIYFLITFHSFEPNFILGAGTNSAIAYLVSLIAGLYFGRQGVKFILPPVLIGFVVFFEFGSITLLENEFFKVIFGDKMKIAEFFICLAWAWLGSILRKSSNTLSLAINTRYFKL